jgi:hypothetical protein
MEEGRQLEEFFVGTAAFNESWVPQVQSTEPQLINTDKIDVSNTLLFANTATTYDSFQQNYNIAPTVSRRQAILNTAITNFDSAVQGSLNTAQQERFDTFKRDIQATTQRVENIATYLNDEIRIRQLSPPDSSTSAAAQRAEQMKHPDKQASYYEQPWFLLNRPLRAPWLYTLLALSVLILLVSIGIFMRMAHIEFDIKFPTSEGPGMFSGLFDSFSTMSPMMYFITVGGGLVVGGVAAYFIAKYT